MCTKPFVAGLLAYVWLGESLSVFQIVMMLFCFGGITLAAVSSEESEVTSESKISSYQGGITLCCVLALVYAILSVTTRRLKDCHFSLIQFYMVLTGFVASVTWILILWSQKTVFDFSGKLVWLELIGASIFFWIKNVLVTCLNQSMNPATVGMFFNI